MTPSSQHEELSSRIKSIRIAMFTTIDEHGFLVSHPMTSQDLDADGYLWFFTSDQTAVWRHVGQNNHVNVSYSDTDNSVYVSVSGHAEQSRDPARMRELWNPMLDAWFPKGLADPHLSLLRVHAHTAEYWDAHASKMVQMFRLAKAAVTGHPPPTEPGEHGTIRLN